MISICFMDFLGQKRHAPSSPLGFVGRMFLTSRKLPICIQYKSVMMMHQFCGKTNLQWPSCLEGEGKYQISNIYKYTCIAMIIEQGAKFRLLNPLYFHCDFLPTYVCTTPVWDLLCWVSPDVSSAAPFSEEVFITAVTMTKKKKKLQQFIKFGVVYDG